MSWTTWDLAQLPVVAAAVALALFAGGFLRLRRRGGARHADGWRVLLIVLALALATLPLVSPLDRAGDEFLLAAHMLQHVLLGDTAPALALVALRGPLLFFVLPAPILRLLGHRRLLRGTLAFLLRPSVSLAVRQRSTVSRCGAGVSLLKSHRPLRTQARPRQLAGHRPG